MDVYRTGIICLIAAFSPALGVHAQALNRVAATSLTLPAEPPRMGFTTEVTLGGLAFAEPVAIAVPPGETNRLFVVEKAGRIIVVPDLSNPSASVFLDIRARVGNAGGEMGLLALAFHPNYAANGYFYVWHTLNTTTQAGSGRHDRLARYQVSANPDAADPNSELPLITQFDQASNHNGGDIHFGADGYLYLSLGDEGGANNAFGNGQRIDRDFFSAILRLDVDLRPESLPPNPHPAVNAGAYAIPPDNPFIGATTFNGASVDPASVRTEIWATGLRNPFRFSFDPATRKLWVGDVGQDAFEEIDTIERGGNYGWPFREGFIAGPVANPPAGARFADPVHHYAHGNGGASVTGGIVYRGSAFPALRQVCVRRLRHGTYLGADSGCLRSTGGRAADL